MHPYDYLVLEAICVLQKKLNGATASSILESIRVKTRTMSSMSRVYSSLESLSKLRCVALDGKRFRLTNQGTNLLMVYLREKEGD